MEPASLLLVICGIGLVLLLAWTMYRIQNHRKKMRILELRASDISTLSSEQKKERTPRNNTPPILPDNELLVVLFRNKKRPWRSAVNLRTERGDPVLIITSRPPKEMKRLYPGVKKMIWLDRSTAHDLDEDTLVVNPTNLSSLLEEVRSHLGKKSVVVFEGFEEVLSANEIDRVIRFLNMLKQTCSERSISAVVPLPYRAVPQRVRSQLTEGFESVVIG